MTVREVLSACGGGCSVPGGVTLRRQCLQMCPSYPEPHTMGPGVSLESNWCAWQARQQGLRVQRESTVASTEQVCRACMGMDVERSCWIGLLGAVAAEEACRRAALLRTQGACRFGVSSCSGCFPFRVGAAWWWAGLPWLFGGAEVRWQSSADGWRAGVSPSWGPGVGWLGESCCVNLGVMLRM